MNARHANALREWLCEHAPANVLMPCAVGSKAPSHVHKNGAWTWSKFDAIKKDAKFYDTHDVGLLLQDLCVIDVDDDALGVQLEQEFPELRVAPCEKTRKGRHYFFRRSPLCDADGYYDGAAQIRPGLDFKTVCSQGTSGFVVVAPSTNKRWVRPMWMHPPPYIGDDLLKRVAVPRHAQATVDIILMPEGDRVTIVDNPFIMQFSTIRQIVEDLPGETVTIGACTRQQLDDLMFCCQHGITKELPTVQYAHEILRVADYLGVPRKYMGPFRCGSAVHRLLDVARTWPAMATLMHAETLARRRLILEIPVEDCAIPADAARVSVDQQWLLPSPMVSETPNITSDLKVPSFVHDVLTAHAGHLVLAGGGALATVVPSRGPPNDYDLFLIDVSENQAVSIVQDVCSRAGAKVVYRSKSAITLVVRSVCVQIILRRYQSVSMLLCSFDIAPCKVAVFATADGTLQACAMPTWKASMASMCFVVDLDVWGVASLARVLKYASQGFRVYVPCTSRDCFLTETMRSARGVGALFAFERRARRVPFPTRDDVARGIRRIKRLGWRIQESDYGTVKKMSGALRYWVRWLLHRISRRPVDVTVYPYDFPLVDASSNFFPCSADWRKLYNMEAWMQRYVALLDVGPNLAEYVRYL